LGASILGKAIDIQKFCETKEGDPSKPKVLIIHGFLSSSMWQRDMARELNKRGYTTLNCLMRGHGKRKNESSMTDWVGMLDDVNDIVNKTDGDIVIIGHSMGGTLAITEAIKNPKVKKVFALGAINGKGFFNGNAEKLKEKMKYAKDKFETIEPVFPSNNSPECNPKNKERFFLAHSIHDEIVPFQQFEQNVKDLCLEDAIDTNTLVLDKNGRKWNDPSPHRSVHVRKDVYKFIFDNLE
jgi:esterase/lipase